MKQFLPTPPAGVDRVADSVNSRAQTVSIEPGESHGGPEHSLPESDCWIYVLNGTGRAVIDDQPVELRPGVVVLVEPGERHELSNTGDTPLQTLNIYAP